jgi:hypothetical protein
MPLTCGSVGKWCRGWLVCTCVLGLAVSSGCSSGTFPTGEVSGTVKFKGEPISQGKITFISTDGTGNFGSDIISDGAYKIKAPLGLCKIEIQVQSNENKYAVSQQQFKMMRGKMKEMKAKGMDVPDEPPQLAKKPTLNFPEKYKVADQSGLEFDVKAGEQTKDWDLH